VYVAQTVTLTTSAQTLLALVEAALGASLPQARATELFLQGDSSAAGTIRIGGADLTATKRGYDLATNGERHYRVPVNLGDIYALSSTATDKLHVEVIGS
jgi:hypothetical protein